MDHLVSLKYRQLADGSFPVLFENCSCLTSLAHLATELCPDLLGNCDHPLGSLDFVAEYREVFQNNSSQRSTPTASC